MSFEMQTNWPSSLQTPEQRQMGLLLHLSQLANLIMFRIGIVVPIIIWQTQKEKMPAIDAHGRMVVNWMISCTIYTIASLVLMFVLIGFLTILVVALIGIIFPIVGAVKANGGELWNYPLTIKFLK